MTKEEIIKKAKDFLDKPLRFYNCETCVLCSYGYDFCTIYSDMSSCEETFKNFIKANDNPEPSQKGKIITGQLAKSDKGKLQLTQIIKDIAEVREYGVKIIGSDKKMTLRELSERLNRIFYLENEEFNVGKLKLGTVLKNGKGEMFIFLKKINEIDAYLYPVCPARNTFRDDYELFPETEKISICDNFGANLTHKRNMILDIEEIGYLDTEGKFQCVHKRKPSIELGDKVGITITSNTGKNIMIRFYKERGEIKLELLTGLK